MLRWASRAAFVALAVSLVSTDARAAATPDDAVRSFEAAEQAYADGRYAEAVDLLTALVETHPDPILHYNLGRAYEQLGQADQAIESYDRYLELDPEAPDHDAVSERVLRLKLSLELEAQQRDAAQRQEESALEDPSAPPNPGATDTDAEAVTAADVVPWVLLGVGAAGLATGAVLGGTSRARRQDAQDAPSQREAASALEAARSFAVGANVAFAVGGALAVAGLAWGIVRVVRRRRSGGRSASHRIAPGPAGFVIGGRF